MKPDETREITAGARALDEFIKRTGVTLDDFGSTLSKPVSGVTVHRWLKGKARPSFENAKKIEAVSDGKIKATAFFPDLVGTI